MIFCFWIFVIYFYSKVTEDMQVKISNLNFIFLGSLLGHVCEDPAGVRGVCVERHDCVVQRATKPGTHIPPLSLCGYHGRDPVFCCRGKKTTD